MFVSSFVVFMLLSVSSTIPTSSICQLKSATLSDTGSRSIAILCDGDEFLSVEIDENTHVSKLRITGGNFGNIREFMSVRYLRDSQDMFLTINGEEFNVKDERKDEESAKMEELLKDPEFSFFPTAVRLIHDELELKGWESPAVMFLYRLAMGIEAYYGINQSGNMRLEKRHDVDPDTYKYHGLYPPKSCQFNGETVSDMLGLIASKCRGVCGQTCSTCWKWVCGDCCVHPGCLIHDGYCDDGYLAYDCFTCRGVLWDTITDTPLDC